MAIARNAQRAPRDWCLDQFQRAALVPSGPDCWSQAPGLGPGCKGFDPPRVHDVTAFHTRTRSAFSQERKVTVSSWMSDKESNPQDNGTEKKDYDRQDFFSDLKKASRRLDADEADRTESDRPDERSQSDPGTSA